MPYSCWLPVCLNEQKERKIKNTAMKSTPYDEKASCWKSFMIWRLNDRQLYFVHPSYTMSAWNQGSAPDALTTCIPAAGACIVHTSYQPAQFKYFAVLLNFSSHLIHSRCASHRLSEVAVNCTLMFSLHTGPAVCERSVQYMPSIYHMTNTHYENVIILLCQTGSALPTTSDAKQLNVIFNTGTE